jgi:hypothetical protein
MERNDYEKSDRIDASEAEAVSGRLVSRERSEPPPSIDILCPCEQDGERVN